MSWTLSEEEVRAALEGNHIAVSQVSPLSRIVLSARFEGRVPRAIDPNLLRAIQCVASPRVEIGVFLSPPRDGSFIWHYRGGEAPADALAAYRKDRAGGHSFLWTSTNEVARTVRDCLQLDLPSDDSGPTLELTPIGYMAFLSLIDANREATLQSLLKRSPVPQQSFTGARVLDSFNHGRTSNDMRWLVGLAQVLSPLDFRMTQVDCDRALAELSERGLVTAVPDGWAVSPRMNVLCALLGSPLAYSGLHRRRLTAERSDNTIAVRGLGGLWLIRFLGLNSTVPRIRLSSAGSTDVELALAEALNDVTEDAAPSPASSPPAPVKLPPCRSCGHPTPTEARYCSRCGADQRPVTPAARRCRSCDAVIADAGSRFCQSCAAPLAGEPSQPPQVCSNRECGRPVPEGARFCTYCGNPVATAAPAPPVDEDIPVVLPVREERSNPPPRAARVPSAPPGPTPAPAPAPQVRRCPNAQCGRPVAPGKKFCISCGSKLG